MSKALIEKNAQAFAHNHQQPRTTVSITRYDNMMHSRGSFIPLCVQQGIQGEPMTVTEPCMARSLMSIRDRTTWSSTPSTKPSQAQCDALCVLSDSGTISEESSLIGFPAVTLRDSIERPEALDTGAIVMTGLDPENVVEAVRDVVHSAQERTTRSGHLVPADYDIDNCSQRAVRFILSTHRRHAQWSGIRR